MLPKAPDANDDIERTIELIYNGSSQAHEAWQVSYKNNYQILRHRIMCLPDIQGNFNKEIETLKSWGLEVREVTPNLHQIWHKIKYLLHDTPMVREILQRIDYSIMAKVADNAQTILQRTSEKNSGYAFAAMIRIDANTVELRPILGRQIHVIKKDQYGNIKT